MLEGVGDSLPQTTGGFGLRPGEGEALWIHIHRHEDEFFAVISGEVRGKHGNTVMETVAGSLVYGPPGIPHGVSVDPAEARLLLFFGPTGVEGFFREGGKPAGSIGLPPPGEEFLDR